MAPEVLRCPAKERPEDNKAIRRLQYTNSVDAWAVGVFAYELVVGFPPFASNCATDSMERIMSGPSAVVFPRRMSEAARGFIGDALQMHPGDRPTVREMLLQPWVAQHSVSTVKSQSGAHCGAPAVQRTCRDGYVASSMP